MCVASDDMCTGLAVFKDCLAVEVHGWIVGAFVCAISYVVSVNAWPLFLQH